MSDTSEQFWKNIFAAQDRQAQADPSNFLTEYDGVKTLPALNGRYAGVRQQAFTGGLFVGLAEWGYEWRYCYPTTADALAALKDWDGTGDPPGPWVKLKGKAGGDRLGPGALQ